MKHICKYLTLSLVIAMMTLSLPSCGSDDKDDEPEKPITPNEPEATKSVVGVWRLDFEDGYQLMTFEKNGKYSLVEFDLASGNWSEHGEYSIKGNVMTMVCSEGEVSVYSILTHTAKTLILRYEGEYLGQYPNQYDENVEYWTRVE